MDTLDSNYKSAMTYALKRLSVKSQPAIELRKKLKDRQVQDDIIDRIIEECQRLGYLNDEEWIQSFIRRQMARNLGPQAIEIKLRAKGICKEEYRNFLSALDNSELQEQRIHHLLETRYRSRDLTDIKSREKVIASLMRKGFSFHEIQNVIKTSKFP